MTIEADVSPGQAVLVQETYDPSWHARSAGRDLPVHEDAIGFMWIDVPPGRHLIDVTFETPPENQLGRILSVACLLACLVLLARSA